MSKEKLGKTIHFFFQIFCPPVKKSTSWCESLINSKILLFLNFRIITTFFWLLTDLNLSSHGRLRKKYKIHDLLFGILIVPTAVPRPSLTMPRS